MCLLRTRRESFSSNFKKNSKFSRKTFKSPTLRSSRPNEIILRGANWKSLSLLANEATKRDWIISDESAKKQYNKSDGKYQGAIVLEPQVGLHNSPISTLDFKSLYPSILSSQNLCPWTFVESPMYLGLDDVEYKTFAWSDVKIRLLFLHICAKNEI